MSAALLWAVLIAWFVLVTIALVELFRSWHRGGGEPAGRPLGRP